VPSTLLVTNNLDDGSAGSLRSAVIQANADAAGGLSDTINFDSSLAGATITLTQGQLELNGATTGGTITIDASNLSSPVAISGTNAIQARVFQVDANTTAVMSGLTIENGNDPYNGGGIFNAGTLQINQSTISNNVEAHGGGGIFNAATLTLNNSVVSNNFALSGDGGGIYNQGTVTLTKSTVNGNFAQGTVGFAFAGGGGICNVGLITVANSTINGNRTQELGGGIDSDGELTVTNSQILSNTAIANGGGIFSHSLMALSDSSVSGNSAGRDGGGIYFEDPSHFDVATLNNVTIANNRCNVSGSGGNGGGIFNDGTLNVNRCTISGDSSPNGQGGGIFNNNTLTLSNTTVSGNAAFDGGGIYNSAFLTLTYATVSANSANDFFGGGGGGIYNALDLWVSYSTISGNEAHIPPLTEPEDACNGGGIFNGYGLVLSNSIVSHNSADFNGGGIYNVHGAMISNSTICNNLTGIYGGGIWLFNTTETVLTNVTIAGNSAGYSSTAGQGGGIFSLQSPSDPNPVYATLNNTIVADNVVYNILNQTSVASYDIEGPLASASAYNLLYNTENTGLENGVNHNLTAGVLKNPFLAPLSNNGGPTQTIPLIPDDSQVIEAGSVALAVDAFGNPLTTDQRGAGYARTHDGTVDIGAYEVQPVTSASLQQELSSTNSATIQAGTSLDAQNAVTAVNGLTAQTSPVTVTLDLGSGTYTDIPAHPQAGVTLVINGIGTSTTILGHSPALTVSSGNVLVTNVTISTPTNDPTVLVSGGSLTLRNDNIQGTTGFSDPVISVTGGGLDLGTAQNPGGNTLNINGTGPFINNQTGNQITQMANTFEVNGNIVTQPIAFNDSYTAIINQALSVPALGVLSNVLDPNGSLLTAVLTRGPNHGALQLNGNGAFVYTPAPGYSGFDAFAYQVRTTSGALSNAATVTINVQRLDPTFGNGGIVTINLHSPDDELDNAFVLPDGKILAVGVTQLPNNDFAVMLTKFQANGSLDLSYGTNGVAVTGLTSPNYIQPNDLSDGGVACAADGSIVIRGNLPSPDDPFGGFPGFAANQLTRYEPNGSLDTGFGTNGILTINDDFNDIGAGGSPGFQAFALQPDGKILITGSTVVGQFDSAPFVDTVLERLNVDGSLDNNPTTGFGPDHSGKVVANLGIYEPAYGVWNTYFSQGNSLAVQPDGKILVGGGVSIASNPGTNGDGFLARFQSDGTLDTSFGYRAEVIVFDQLAGPADPVGPAAVPFKDPNGLDSGAGPIVGITAQADGKILVVPGDGLLIRLNQNGTLDSSFASDPFGVVDGSNGFTLDTFGVSVFGTKFRVDGEGRIAFPEFVGDPVAGYNDFAVSRLDSLGNPDSTFGSGGTGTTFINLGADSYTQGLDVQPDGKIVLVGTTFDASKQGWDITLARLQGDDQLAVSSNPATVQQQLATTVSFLQNSSTDTTLPPVVLAADPTTVDSVLAAVNALPEPPSGTTPRQVEVDVNLSDGSYSDVSASPPLGVTLVINGNGGSTTIVGNSPALAVASGNVVVENLTLTTATDAPTILVTGGSLTLRNDTIQESTGSSDAAISVTGGTADMGTTSDPGGNIININGTGTFISNTTASPVSAGGNTFEINGQVTAWPITLTVNTSSSLMLVSNSPPPLTGTVNGTPFTGSTTYTTPFGDQVTITLSTAATSASPVGQYPITATLSDADAGNYAISPATSTVGTMYVVSLGADPSSTTGAKAVVFWDNKGNGKLISAADLSSLDALNLVTQGGSAFDPRSVAQLQAWLSVSPNATTAYQLAVQLAVTDLNVLAGYVHTGDLVYAGGLLPYASAYAITGLTSGGFIDIQNLMNAANAILSQVSPGNRSGDPNQAYEAALAQVLLAANANTDFVSPELLWGLVGTFV
jgi:uncharacterized delta-60 repeat protein